MSKRQLTNPILAMFASIIMCALLSACQSSKAETSAISDYSAKNHNIQINEKDHKRWYRVNGKSFTFDQLSKSQKVKVVALEKTLDRLETGLEMEKHMSKIDQNKISEIEQHAKKLEMLLLEIAETI